MKKLSLVVLMVAVMTQLNACVLLAGAAIGGVAGYEASKQGYTVQSPLTKEKKTTTTAP